MNHSVNTKTNPLRSAISAEAILDHLVTATLVLDDDLEVVFGNSAAESVLIKVMLHLIAKPPPAV